MGCRKGKELSLEPFAVSSLYRFLEGAAYLVLQVTHRGVCEGNDKHIVYTCGGLFVKKPAYYSFGQRGRLTRACRRRYEQCSVSRFYRRELLL